MLEQRKKRGARYLFRLASWVGTLFAVYCLTGGVSCSIASETTDECAVSCSEEGSATVGPARRFVGTGIALVPGAVVHGAGHLVIGEGRTARRLMGMELLGLGMLGAGGVPLALTAATGPLAGAFIALALMGSSLFATSWVADVYGSSTLGSDQNGLHKTSILKTRAGYGFVYNPNFEHRNFAVASVDLRIARFRVSPEAWLALDDDNQLARIETAWRLFGPRPRHATDRGGSYGDVQLGAYFHRYGTEGFRIATMEAFAPMRMDMGLVGPTLNGMFVEAGVGLAMQRIEYVSVAEVDRTALLLARGGFGFYLGGVKSPGGELLLYYDHRHDGFAGGMALRGHETTFLGHVGAKLDLRFFEIFGLDVEFQVGSAYVAQVNLTFRGGV